MSHHPIKLANEGTTFSTEATGPRARYREAYQRVLSELSEREPDGLVALDIDVLSAYTTVIGALPRIRTFRERASRLAEFELENFDKLESHALALMHAQGEYVSASAPPEVLAALGREGNALRDNLYSDALALANRGLVSAEPLKELRGAFGAKNLAEDLVRLSSLLRRNWQKIGSLTVVTMAELDQAEQLSERILHAIAMRENASDILAEAIRKRLKMFTLLASAYDQVRRAICYLRWQEEDVDEIAPSLDAGRVTHKPEPKSPAPIQHGRTIPGSAVIAQSNTATPTRTSGAVN